MLIAAALAFAVIPLFDPATWEPGALERYLSAVMATPEDGYAAGSWTYDAYKDPAGYRATLGGFPAESYDPSGFLATLGLSHPLGSGRTDEQLLAGWRLTDYQPDPRYLPVPSGVAGPAQWVLLGGAKGSPWVIQGVVHGLTALIITGMEKVDREDPFPYGRDEDIATSSPTPEAPGQRYAGALAKRTNVLRWGPGVHIGSTSPEDTGEAWGTYDIARGLGFDAAASRTISEENYNCDLNKTHYTGRITGSGSGGKKGDFHWHFNRASAGSQDTRIAAAKLHLERAIRLARERYYDAAEREIGIGLHGLQDMFTHGQISPLTHALVGEYPDKLRYHPVSMFETAIVTEGYLSRYLDAVGVVAPPIPAPASAATVPVTGGSLDLSGVPFAPVLARAGVSVRIKVGPSSYDRARRMVTLGEPAALRHELVHALDQALEDDPALVDRWKAYRERLHREARRAGKISFDGPDSREYLAQTQP